MQFDHTFLDDADQRAAVVQWIRHGAQPKVTGWAGSGSKPGPLLPTLMQRIDADLLARAVMMADDPPPPPPVGDKDDAPKTFTQEQLNQHIADRLARDRATRSDYDDLKAKATELEALKAAGQTEQEKAVTKARKEAEDAARSDERSKADTRVLRAEVKALAGTRFASPTDALALLDLTGLKVGDDGEVDEKAITARLEQLLNEKPYLAAANGTPPAGGGLSGLGQGNRPPAGKTTGREAGMAEAERRFGKKPENSRT